MSDQGKSLRETMDENYTVLHDYAKRVFCGGLALVEREEEDRCKRVDEYLTIGQQEASCAVLIKKLFRGIL